MEGFDRFEICAAYYIIGVRHHGGQWSEGYRKMSQLARIGYRPGLSVENACGEYFDRTSEDQLDARRAAAALLRRLRRTGRINAW